MIGGMTTLRARIALMAAGLLVSASPVLAGDLGGGGCCADLEERVAELEAVSARKGNRKVSLTITGQVNRAIMYWNDGHKKDTYIGLDNTASSSRFSLLGEGRLGPNIKMGFEIMIEIEAGGTMSKVNQLDEDGKIAHTAPLGNNISFNPPNTDAFFGDARRVAFWVEHDKLGRLTLGRYEGTGTPYTIDLGGIAVVAPASKAIMHGGFFLRGTAGQFYNAQWSTLLDQTGTIGGALGRVELLRWDSPVWRGFVFGAHIAEASDYWGAQVRYANELRGFRIAAHIGIDQSSDRLTTGITTGGADLALLDPTSPFYTGGKPDVRSWGAALSLMHVQTGLFVQGHWMEQDFNSPIHVPNAYYGSTGGATKKDATDWLIQAGLTRNWLGWGHTSVYGEYGRSLDYGAASAGRNFAGSTACAFNAGAAAPINCASGFSSLFGVTDTEARVWGIGVVQNIDSAATELYLGYRNYEAKIIGEPGVLGAYNPAAGSYTVTSGGARQSIGLDDLHVVTGGARIKF